MKANNLDDESKSKQLKRTQNINYTSESIPRRLSDGGSGGGGGCFHFLVFILNHDFELHNKKLSFQPNILMLFFSFYSQTRFATSNLWKANTFHQKDRKCSVWDALVWWCDHTTALPQFPVVLRVFKFASLFPHRLVLSSFSFFSYII